MNPEREGVFDGVAFAVAVVIAGFAIGGTVTWVCNHVPNVGLALICAMLAAALGIAIWRWTVWIRRALARRNRT